MKEIEYKFLIDKLPTQTNGINCNQIVNIKQLYYEKSKLTKFLSLLKMNEDELKQINLIRLRIENVNGKISYVLNVKSNGNKIRDEFEVGITKNIANEILSLKSVGEIYKTRYKVKFKNYIFEFDEYLQSHKGLFVCEVEVNKDNDDYKTITNILSKYFNCDYKDITKDAKFKNVNLSKEL